MRPLFILLSVLLVVPLAGVIAWGLPLEQYLEFPPKTLYVEHEAFSVWVFLGYACFTVFVLAPFVRHWLKGSAKRRYTLRCQGTWPWWASVGVVLCLGAWGIAWTRIPLFSPVQRHTFFGLWLGYILAANGLCVLFSGKSPFTTLKGQYLLLFPASALFWWTFEYLNRFVQNWSYQNTQGFSPFEYFVFASLSFSTVLPAVFVTKELFSATDLARPFKDFVWLPASGARSLAWMVSVLSVLILFFTGIFPNVLFPALWVVPPLLLYSLSLLSGSAAMFERLGKGDWQEIVEWALAALVSGVFWELWNYYSYCKWIYHIPYVETAKIFEMPLLGYAGYLPFGVFCGAVIYAIFSTRSDYSA